MSPDSESIDRSQNLISEIDAIKEKIQNFEDIVSDLQSENNELNNKYNCLGESVDELLEKDDSGTKTTEMIKSGIENSRNWFFDKLINFLTLTTTFSFGVLIWVGKTESKDLVYNPLLLDSLVLIVISIVFAFIILTLIIYQYNTIWDDYRNQLKLWKRVNQHQSIQDETQNGHQTTKRIFTDDLYEFFQSIVKTLEYNSFFQKPVSYLYLYLIDIGFLFSGIILYIQASA
ncbi:hypothetical protein DSECCO2_247580 [anaerobic digester metagenome]